jgi:hypothetical protein
MDKIVGIAVYKNGHLVYKKVVENTPIEKCRTEKEILENGTLIETYYSC